MSPVETMLLGKILNGKIRLGDRCEISYYHESHKRWKTKKPNQHKRRWRFSFTFERRSLTVYRSRLVWLIANRILIPTGHFVDHKDEDRENDNPDNLRLMKIGDSHAQGNRIQSDLVVEQLGRWFEFVGQHDREPETIEEESYVEIGF